MFTWVFLLVVFEFSFSCVLLKRYIVIDTDAGTDDFEAILYTLATRGVTVVGITTVAGNVGVNQATTNVLRVLSYIGQTKIPVYKGTNETYDGSEGESDSFYGDNGIGDVELPEESFKEMSYISATNALIMFSKKYYKRLEIFAIGPLTNIARAMKLDQKFGHRLGAIHILGSDRNIETIENVTPFAEFNFWYDPAAAKKVLQGIPGKTPTYVMDWNAVLMFAPNYSVITAITNGQPKKNVEKIHSLFTILENPNNTGNSERIRKNYTYVVADLMTAVTGKFPKVMTTELFSLCNITITGEQKGHTTYCKDSTFPKLHLPVAINATLFKRSVLLTFLGI